MTNLSSRQVFMTVLNKALALPVAIILMTASSNARVSSVQQPKPPVETCPQADGEWTAQEKYVWARVCSGNPADFNEGSNYGGRIDPKAHGLPDSRVLRPSFLRTILLDARYDRALPPRGVRISGARFKEVLDLENAELLHELWIDESLLEKGASLRGLTSTASVTFDGSKIIGPLDLYGANIGRELLMRKGEFGDIDLSNSSVASNVDLGGSVLTGTLWLEDSRIGENLSINAKARLTTVRLGRAQLKGQLNLQEAKITGQLNMEGLQAGIYLLMDKGADFNDIVLASARLGGPMSLQDTTIAGSLDMTAVHLADSLYLNRASVSGEVNLGNTVITGNLDLRNSKLRGALRLEDIRVESLFAGEGEFASVDLWDAQIKGQLNLQKATIVGLLDMERIQADGYVALEGATINEVRLNFAHLGDLLTFSGANVKGSLDMSETVISGVVDFRRSKINGALTMAGVQVGGNVLMNDKATFAFLSLVGARLKGQLDLSGSIVTGQLLMNDIQIDRHCFMDDGATFHEVILSGAKLNGISISPAEEISVLEMVGAQIERDLAMDKNFGAVRLQNTHVLGYAYMNQTKISKSLDMAGVEVAHDLQLRGAELTGLTLTNAHVAGYVDLRGSKVTDQFDGQALAVDGSALLGSGSEFVNDIDLSLSIIKGDLDLVGGTLRGNLNLTSARIERRFTLRGDEPLGSVTLPNLNVSDIEWGPDPLLVLNRMSGSSSMYIPGLYERLAKSYIDVGQPDLARSILIAKQNAEYRHTNSTAWKALLFVWWSVSAYGYRPEVGFIWIAIMVCIGVIVFRTGNNQVQGNVRPENWLFFSLDSVLPVINLDKKHEEIRFNGWRQYFLYFLRFLGAVLVVLVLDYLKDAITISK